MREIGTPPSSEVSVSSSGSGGVGGRSAELLGQGERRCGRGDPETHGEPQDRKAGLNRRVQGIIQNSGLCCPGSGGGRGALGETLGL